MSDNRFAPGGVVGWMVGVVKRGREGMAAKRAEREMEVVETLSLGGRRQLALVQCGGRKFLVGMGQDSVDCIAAVEEESRPAAQKSALRVMGGGF